MSEIVQFFDVGTGIGEVNIVTQEWRVILGGLNAYYRRVADLQRAGFKAEHIGKVDPDAHGWKLVPSAPPPK